MVSKASWDKFYYWYFVIHIPVTIFMDSSLIIPRDYQLSVTKTLVGFHVASNKDFLLQEPVDLWLKFFGLIELLFQLPFFILSVINRLPHKNLWNLIYGVNVVLTTACCMVYVALEFESYGLTLAEASKLIAIYAPYLLISLQLSIDSFNRIIS